MNWNTRIKYGIALLLWGYILYRAVCFSITQDEAHSYLLAKTDNWRQMAGTTNTHWLNTLFVRLIVLLPGEDAVWKLRLLSILSWGVYAWSAIKLSEDFPSKWLGTVFFAALVLNPFVLFYFSLERGYAPAFALLLLALWFVHENIKHKAFDPARWTPVFLLAALASLANFSAFYFLMAISVGLAIYLVVTRRYRAFLTAKAWLVWFILGSVTSFTAVALFFVRSRNELYYGGTNLSASMIGSMLQGSCYLDPHYQRYESVGVQALLTMQVPLAYQYLALAIFIFFVLALFWLGYRLLQSGKLPLALVAVSLFLLMLLLNGILHALFATPYLFSRTALVLYPLMTTAIFALLQESCRSTFLQRVLTGGLSVLLLLNFAKSFSLQTFVEWPVQTNTKTTLDYLEKKGAKHVGLNVWDYSLLANYFSQAYPGRYTFRYAALPDNRNGEPITPETVQLFDYLVLSPPLDSTLIKTWIPQKTMPFSKTVILKAPAGQHERQRF